MYIIGKHKLLGLLAVGLVLLTGCQSDGSADGSDTPRQAATMEMQAYATTYNDVVQAASTRAWPPSDDFVVYSGQDQIKVAFTQGNAVVKGYNSDKDAMGLFRFQPGANKWGSTFVLPAASASDYYLYGYMPASGNLVLEPVDGVSGNFANGAKMTISGLPSATTDDVCVIVGVKKGVKISENPDVYSGSDIIMGQFGYKIEEGQNHVYLLCDHLYAALQLSIRVDATYHALRHIKLKRVWVKNCKIGDAAPFKSTLTATVRLEKTNTGITDPSLWSSPIQEPITFASDASSADMNMEQNTLYVSDSGLDLTTDYKPVQGYMGPLGMTSFTLVSQYDVYDTNGNLIRDNQTAENQIIIKDLFKAITTLQRGKRYTLYLTVKPTYLYMMSEPDLENPTPIID